MRIFFYFFLFLTFYGCASQKVNVIEGYDYKEKDNQTSYFVLPYGSVLIQGKWNKDHYNSVSLQQFFINADSIKIAVAFNGFKNYEFNLKGEKKGLEFTKAYYEWDTKYFKEKYGLNSEILESDSINNYMIYKVYGKSNQATVETYYLLGEKNGNVSNISIEWTDKWNEKLKIDFLKDLYTKK